MNTLSLLGVVRTSPELVPEASPAISEQSQTAECNPRASSQNVAQTSNALWWRSCSGPFENKSRRMPDFHTSTARTRFKSFFLDYSLPEFGSEPFDHSSQNAPLRQSLFLGVFAFPSCPSVTRMELGSFHFLN